MGFFAAFLSKAAKTLQALFRVHTHIIHSRESASPDPILAYRREITAYTQTTYTALWNDECCRQKKNLFQYSQTCLSSSALSFFSDKTSNNKFDLSKF